MMKGGREGGRERGREGGSEEGREINLQCFLYMDWLNISAICLF